MGNLDSSLGTSARIEFSVSLTLDQNIFNYLSDTTLALQTAASAEQSSTQQGQTSSAGSGGSSTTTNSSSTNGQQAPQVKSSEKLITSFHILHPEVQGAAG